MTREEAIEILEQIKSTFQKDEWMEKDVVALDTAIHDMKAIEKLKLLVNMYSQQGHAPTRTISMEDLGEIIE